MKKKALIGVNLAGFLHFLWNDISTLQEMGYEVSVAMNENSAAGPNPVSYTHLDVYKRQVYGGFFYKGKGKG